MSKKNVKEKKKKKTYKSDISYMSQQQIVLSKLADSSLWSSFKKKIKKIRELTTKITIASVFTLQYSLLEIDFCHQYKLILWLHRCAPLFQWMCNWVENPRNVRILYHFFFVFCLKSHLDFSKTYITKNFPPIEKIRLELIQNTMVCT